MKSSLNQHVLVLNKNWVVIATTTTQNAIVLMCRDSAKALCPSSFMVYDWESWISEDTNLPTVSDYIKTPNLKVPAPQIIILTNYNDVHVKSVKFSPRAIYRRDNYTCQYCQKKKRMEELSIDHILPKSRKGENTWENCVAACFKCNNKKSNKTPKEAGYTLNKKPLKPKWNPVVHITKDQRPECWKPLLKDNW